MKSVTKKRAQIRGYPGRMAHRRQIAQWSGTRTTHPGGTGFEPRRGLQGQIALKLACGTSTLVPHRLSPWCLFGEEGEVISEGIPACRAS